jgi:hypothetical protein
MGTYDMGVDWIKRKGPDLSTPNQGHRECRVEGCRRRALATKKNNDVVCLKILKI